MSTPISSNAHAVDDSDLRQQQLAAALLLAAFVVVLRLLNVSELARARFAPSIRSPPMSPRRSRLNRLQPACRDGHEIRGRAAKHALQVA